MVSRQKLSHRLTSREQEVLRLLAEGLSCKDIAGRLHIAPRTVGNHLSHMYRKLGVNSAVLAVRWAIRAGMVEP